ncbi:hypothetical protein FACS1894139_01090 [Planctomycetales bacterium]|nr:hypothetical protein FACS1894107_04160 [Planctomycetales bacterium]GHT02607.1 hypothetical protein FACS1894139_01090 [Planctomycetales bacterium]
MFYWRTVWLAIAFTLGCGLLGLRLYQLQVVQAEHYREMGKKRTHRLQQVAPARGRILDRRGRALAEDRPRFELWLRPDQLALPDFSPPENDLDQSAAIGAIANLPSLSRFIDFFRRPNEPVLTTRARVAEAVLTALLKNGAKDGDPAEARRVTEMPLPAALALTQAQANPYTSAEMAGWELRVSSSRVYYYGGLFGHITGYVNALSADEYKTLRGYWENGEPVAGTGALTSKNADGGVFFALNPAGDEAEIMALREIPRNGETQKTWGNLLNPMVGRAGVEQWYNQELRGEHQWRLETLTKVPRGWRTFIEVGSPAPAKNGADLTLTIDADFQRAVRDLTVEELRKLAKQPEHRATLAKHNLTEFSAAAVVMDAHTGAIHALVSLPEFDPNAVRQDYEKLLAAAGNPLRNQVISENYPPGSSLKPLVAFGALSAGKITPGTEFDCEGVEYLGNRRYVCMNRVHHGFIGVAKALRVSCNVFFYHAGGALGIRGLAATLAEFGIGKLTGIDLPNETPGYLAPAAFTGKNWSLGETWHIACGQGKIDATPLQMATAYAMLVNGGKKVRPHLRYDPRRADLTAAETVNLSPAALAAVREGMWEAVQGADYPRGTAWRDGHIPGFAYLGKTGSAQGKKPDTHAWFVAAAPAVEPEIIVAVLVPLGNHGGTTCAPIVRRIIEKYFRLDEFPADDADRDAGGGDESEFTGEAEED